jgi:acyl dehydratase
VTMKSTVYNQNRELVMDGEQKFLLKKRDPTH